MILTRYPKRREIIKVKPKTTGLGTHLVPESLQTTFHLVPEFLKKIFHPEARLVGPGLVPAATMSACDTRQALLGERLP